MLHDVKTVVLHSTFSKRFVVSVDLKVFLHVSMFFSSSVKAFQGTGTAFEKSSTSTVFFGGFSNTVCFFYIKY